MTKKKRFKIIVAAAVFFGLIMTLLGGFKLMIYLFLLLTGLVLGWHGNKLKIVITDYRLALKVNTIQFNAKQTDQYKTKIADLESELRAVQTRLNLQKGDV